MMRLIVCAAELVWSVANVKWPVSATRSADSIVSSPQLADEHDIGVFTECGPERQREALRVLVDLALVHEAALVLVDELDRILDCQDVLVALRVDLVDHRGERGRLADPVGPVTRTSPRGRSASEASTAGRPSSSKPLICSGMTR